MIRSRLPLLYHYAVFFAGLSLLLVNTSFVTLAPQLSDLFIFLLLSLTVKRAGFHVAPKVTHSLVGIVDIAALMIFGAAGAGWVAGLSGFSHIVGISLRDRRLTRGSTFELAAFGFGLKAIMAVLGTALYVALGGVVGSARLTLADLLPVAVLCLFWFALDHLAWGVGEWLEKGWAGVLAFVRSARKASLLVELLPLPLGALLAYLHVNLERPIFSLVALGVVLASIAVQRGADLSRAYATREVALATLNDFSRAISAARLDEPQILELIYQYASRVTDTSNFAISLIDEHTEQVDLSLWFRDGVRQTPRRYPRMEGLAGWVAEQRRSLLVRDINTESLPVRGLLHTAQRTRSAVFVPLMTREKVLGVVSLQSVSPHRFTRDHERILIAMAQQAAVAIEQARLYRAEQYRVRQLETIAEVSQRVAGIFDLEDLMQFVVALLKVNFNYYHVDIYLLDDGTLVHHAGTEPEETLHAYVEVAETTLIGTVAQTGEPLLVNDVRTEPRFTMDPAAPDTMAELVIPLKAEGKLLGVLEIQSNRVDAFRESDQFVMQTLGDQVALAIQEAELFSSVQQEAYISNALLQVAEAVGGLNNVAEILDTVVRLIPLLVGVERCLVLRWDQQAGALVGSAAYGLNEDCARQFRGSRVSLDSIFAEGTPPTTPAPRDVSLPDELAQAWQMPSALVLPMVVRGALLGAFCVDSLAALDARRGQLVNGIANQTALAIETVELEAERDLRARLNQELAIARSIQTALLPDRTPQIEGYEIAAVWMPALQVSGDFYDFLPLLEDRWGFVVADVSDKGVPAAIYMTLTRTIIRAIGLGKATRRTPHQVLERANEIVLADARTDMFATAFYAVLDPAQRTLCYTSAGHCPPLLLHADNQAVEWLHGRGLPLGVQAGIELSEREFALQPGDVIVFYTDGVTEATNADYELFGDDRLLRAVLSAQPRGAQAVMESIVAAVKDFAGGQEQADDLTMVVLRCKETGTQVDR